MNWKAIIVICMVVTSIVLGSLAITNKTKSSNCPKVSQGSDTCTPVWKKKEKFGNSPVWKKKEKFGNGKYRKHFTIRSVAEFAQNFNVENPWANWIDNPKMNDNPGTLDPAWQWLQEIGTDPTGSKSLYGAQMLKDVTYDADKAALPPDVCDSIPTCGGPLVLTEDGDQPPEEDRADHQNCVIKAKEQCRRNLDTAFSGGGENYAAMAKAWAPITEDYPSNMLWDDAELGVAMDFDKETGPFFHPLVGPPPEEWQQTPEGKFFRAPRFISKLGFLGGLFVLNGTHISVGCGMWPAYWLNGYVGNLSSNFNNEYAQDYIDNYAIKCDVNGDRSEVRSDFADHIVTWPAAGEIDLIEETNWTNLNLISFHGGNFSFVRPVSNTGWSSRGDHGIDLGFKESRASVFDSAPEYFQYNMQPTCGYDACTDQCSQVKLVWTPEGGPRSELKVGNWQACPEHSCRNAGTSQAIGTQGSYGPTFNAMGGGTYATRWVPDERFTVWFYPKNEFTDESLIMSGGPLSDDPDPDSWDTAQIYVDWLIGSPAEPTDEYPQGYAPDFPDDRHQPWNYQNIIFNIAVGGDWAAETAPYSCVAVGKNAMHSSGDAVCGENKVTTTCSWGDDKPGNYPGTKDNYAGWNKLVDNNPVPIDVDKAKEGDADNQPLCVSDWGGTLRTGCWGSDQQWYEEGETYPAYDMIYSNSGWSGKAAGHAYIGHCYNADPDNVDPTTGIDKEYGCFDGGLAGNSRNGLKYMNSGAWEGRTNAANQPVNAWPSPFSGDNNFDRDSMFETAGQMGIASGDSGNIGGDNSRTGPNPWNKPKFFTESILSFKSFSVFQILGQDYYLDTSLPIEESLKISPPIYGAVPGTRGAGGIAV